MQQRVECIIIECGILSRPVACQCSPAEGDESISSSKMQEVTMKASDERMQEKNGENGKDEDAEEEVMESASESDGQLTSSSEPDRGIVRKKLRPVIRPRPTKNQRENGWSPTYLTERNFEFKPPPMQQNQAQECKESTPEQTQPEQAQPELSAQHLKSGDFISIRCLIERLEEECEGSERCQVLDAVTLVPGSVPLRHLMETVLKAHHFDASDTFGAKSSILPNSKWLAINLDDVAVDSSTTVADIVRGIETSHMVLKITLPSFSCEQRLRESLLQFLLSIVSSDLFTTTNCPLDKTLLDQLRVGDKKLNLSNNKLLAFKQWVKEFNCSDHLQNGVDHLPKSGTRTLELEMNSEIKPRAPSPKTLDLRASSPRSSNTTFDPYTEITKLNSWFQLNPDPTLTELLAYVDELNRRPFRHSYPIDLSSIVRWFVDARVKSEPPCLPNKNAVYVVDPHVEDSSDSESAVVVQPCTDDGESVPETMRDSPDDVTSTDAFEKSAMKSDENHNNWSSPSMVELPTDQATDLSLVKRSSDTHSRKPWNWKPVALLDPTSRHKRVERDTREYEVSSGSSSPKTIPDNTLPASFYPSYPMATMSALPIHPNSFHAATMQILQQRALYNFSHPVFVPQPYDMENTGSPGSGNEENDRRKRSRVFIDPTTEIPRLENWYLADTHPSAQTIEHYTDELNEAEYRQRFPKLEPKNVQLWFKNHRAKMKRLRLEQVKCETMNGFPGH